MCMCLQQATLFRARIIEKAMQVFEEMHVKAGRGRQLQRAGKHA